MLGGCQATASQPVEVGSLKAAESADQKAEVNLSDPHVRDRLSSQLGSVVGRAKVELGPLGAGWSSVVTVLPPRPGTYETHSPAMPEPFDIVLRDGICMAIRRSTGEAFKLEAGCRRYTAIP